MGNKTKKVPSPTTVKRQWSILSKWIDAELAPMGGQDGTAEMYRAMETVGAYIKATTEMMRCCCDRLNGKHRPDCPQSGAWRRLDK